MRVCVPDDYERVSDRDMQYVLTTRAAVSSRQVIDMGGTTDHPALLVVLDTPAFLEKPPSKG